MREALLQWNVWWQKPEWSEPWVFREDYVREALRFLGKKIIALYGVRRSGKTFIMFQLVKSLLERGVDPKRIVYVNLDDERFPKKASAVDEILNTYYEVTGVSGDFFLFIDEVQRLEEWGGYLRRFSDLRKDVGVVITGSSASILEPEVASKLTGRRIDIEVFPFSFGEYLKAKGIEVRDPLLQFLGEQGIVNHHLENYMRYGGFPEVVLERSEIGKLKYLQSYFTDIIYRDIMERHNVNVRKLKELARFLLENIGNAIRPSRLSDYLDVSKPTLYEYLGYLEEAFMIFLVSPYSSSKERIAGLKKVYCVDTGLRNAVSRTSRDIGRQAENLIYLKLRRHTDEVYYYRKEGTEIDFIAAIGGDLYAVESKFELDEEKERKLERARKVAQKLGARFLVVTKEEIGGGKIPLWLFLLTGPEDWVRYSKLGSRSSV